MNIFRIKRSKVENKMSYLPEEIIFHERFNFQRIEMVLFRVIIVVDLFSPIFFSGCKMKTAYLICYKKKKEKDTEKDHSKYRTIGKDTIFYPHRTVFKLYKFDPFSSFVTSDCH